MSWKETLSIARGSRGRSLLRLAGLAAAWTFTAGANSCSFEGGGGPTFVTQLEIRNAAGSPDREFAPGEPITFELSVRNRSTTGAFLQFRNGQQFDFVVVDSGTRNIRWLWSQGKAFAPALTEVGFAPGETRKFVATWDQAGNDGQPVGPGDYEARGVMVFPRFTVDPFAESQLASSLLDFSIQ